MLSEDLILSSEIDEQTHEIASPPQVRCCSSQSPRSPFCTKFSWGSWLMPLGGGEGVHSVAMAVS